VKIAPNLSSPLLAATLKVFRNTLSNDLRFHWKVGYDSETYWSKHISRVECIAYSINVQSQ
jgi:hypothetical protein